MSSGIALPFPNVRAFRADFRASMITGLSTGIILPAGGLILPSTCAIVKTAFNAATTNVLTFGTSATATELFASGDIDGATANKANVIPVGKCLYLATETTIYWKYTQTGTAATAGSAWLFLHFISEPASLLAA